MCTADPEQGYFTGPTCSQCMPWFAPPNCTTPIRVCPRTAAGVECNFPYGSCAAEAQCVCVSQWAGV